MSSLDRLPKRPGEIIEADRQDIEAKVRAAESLPDEPRVACIAASLDGVMTHCSTIPE
ncbi:MAG: hypothetical protein HYV63_12385 [Candidatus Schekmanbacteria bacterium]|nr:hypothetical protein [Candidatus Schekmanbacteria bacterium]